LKHLRKSDTKYFVELLSYQKNIPGKFRLIHDLSFPKGNSINSHIPSENSAVQYDSIDTVIKLIKHFGRHCLMAKCNIEDAFRLVPIHPTDYHLLVFTWGIFLGISPRGEQTKF
jgi:hypothetical protein